MKKDNLVRFPATKITERWTTKDADHFVEKYGEILFIKDGIPKDKDGIPKDVVADEAIWADQLCRWGPVKWHDGQFIAWTGTHFAPALGLIRPFLQTVLVMKKIKGSSRIIEAIIKALDQKLNPLAPHDRSPWASTRGIPFSNGFYNLHTKELEAHDPKNGNTWVSPVAWRELDDIPDDDRKAVDAYFNSTFADNSAKAAAVLSFIGYSLSPDTDYEKALFLVGRGRNGKGVLLALVAGILGEAARSIDLVELSDDRFASAEIAGKQAALVYDLGRASLGGNTGVFKRMTSFEPIPAQRKHRDPFEFRNTAKLMVATNDLPHSRDVSAGFFARLLLVPFSQTFLGHEDGGLKQRLTSPAALSYIARMAIIAYEEARNAGHLPELPEGKAAILEYQNGLDVISAALSEDGCFERDDNAKIPVSEAYGAFQEWAAASGIAKPPAKPSFTKKMADAGIIHDRNNKTRYLGLKLRRNS